MLYVSKREKDKWGIKDTDSKVETFYTVSEIKGYLKEGKRISGAILLSDGEVVVSKSVAYMDKLDLVKSKMLYGVCRVDEGFELQINDEEIIVTEIEESYFRTRLKELNNTDSFVLTLPDIVTNLDAYFFENFFYIDFVGTVVIDLPSSLRAIASLAMSRGWTNVVVKFNSIVDKIGAGAEDTVYLNEDSLSLNSYTVPVKLIKDRSLALVLRDDRIIKFPYIEEIGVGAVRVILSNSILFLIQHKLRDYFVFQFEFGSNLRVLKNFAQCELADTVSIYNVVYLDDCSSIEFVDFSDLWDSSMDIRFYLFVVKKDQVQLFKELFQGKEIDDRTAIGILGYADENEKSYLQDNMDRFFSDTMKYFGIDYCDLMEACEEINLINH